jgi:hypothetical protein
MTPSDDFNEVMNGFVSIGSSIVVAGPSSSLTVPGIIVSQIVASLSEANTIVRIDVDSTNDFDAGLHRSQSLAAAHHSSTKGEVVSHEAPSHPRLRAQAFREWITPDAHGAIAIVWPGLDNTWLRQFLSTARMCGVPSMVMSISLPRSDHAKVIALAEYMYEADLVLVGHADEGDSLAKAFGRLGPKIEVHKALSLHGRANRSTTQQITAFLPKDNCETLATLLSAYDAIPEAWIGSYNLQIVMRYKGETAEKMVAESYHAEYVHLIGTDISTTDLNRLCASSSALIIADPAFNSRAFSIAVECGVAIVVLASAELPDVGHGYVGALIADMNRPVSVHVALSHALRLAELHFPPPDSWNELVHRLIGRTALRAVPSVTPQTPASKPLVPSRQIG